ncbi:ComF family protein [Bifidobacterium felsineum]
MMMPRISGALQLASRAWRMTRDVLFPRGCAGCDAPDAVLCEQCAGRFDQCRHRALESAGNGADSETPVSVWSAAAYQSVARHAILAWKDHDDVELDAVFGSIMHTLGRRSPLVPLCAGRTVMVVPAPSSPSSMRRRGRWHTLPLAEAVAVGLRERGIDAVAAPMLVSTASGGRSVQQISSAQRAQRIGGHIAVARGMICQGNAVILVDDIITTGSTLRQCVRACRQSGAQVLGALTLADAVVEDSVL